MSKKIRIKELPPRDEVVVPDFVSEAFIGLELPAIDLDELPSELKQVDWLGGDKTQHKNGYAVHFNYVTAALFAVNQKASKWVIEAIPYAPPLFGASLKKQPPIGKMLVGAVHYIVFEKEYCEVIPDFKVGDKVEVTIAMTSSDRDSDYIYEGDTGVVVEVRKDGQIKVVSDDETKWEFVVNNSWFYSKVPD